MASASEWCVDVMNVVRVGIGELWMVAEISRIGFPKECKAFLAPQNSSYLL